MYTSPVSGVQALGLEVARVQGAAGRHEHVGQAGGGLRPVHGAPGPGRAGLPRVEAVSAGLHQRDGVPVTAPPHPTHLLTLLKHRQAFVNQREPLGESADLILNKYLHSGKQNFFMNKKRCNIKLIFGFSLNR